MGKYVPSTSEEQQEMLKAVGVSSFDEMCIRDRLRTMQGSLSHRRNQHQY